MEQKKQVHQALLHRKKNNVLALYAGISAVFTIFFVLWGDRFPQQLTYLSYLFGLFLCLLIVWRINKIRQEEHKQQPAVQTEGTAALMVFGILGFVAGIIGAVALAVVQSVLGVAGISSVSLFGAVILAPVSMIPICAVARRDVRLIMDYCTIGVYCVLAFSKLGCHAGGCCYGIEIQHTVFHRNFFPVQLCESVCTFLIVGFLIWYLLKAKRSISGALYPIATLLYCSTRFVWEFLRHHEDKNYVIAGALTFWQLLAAGCFVISAVWLAVILKKNKR